MANQISRRQFLRLAGGLAATGVLSAACAPVTTAPSTAEAPAAPTEVAPTMAPEIETATIRIGMPAHEAGIKFYEDTVAPRFAEAHPQIEAEWEIAPFGDLWEKLTAQLASDTAPDIFLIDDISIMQYSARGSLYDLTPYVERDAEELKDVIRLENGQDTEGRQFGITRNDFTIALLYHEDLFDEAGLDYPDDTWTWDTLLDAALKLTKDDTGQTADEAGFDPESIVQWGFWSRKYITSDWIPFVHQNGGSLLDPETRTQARFTSPETAEAFHFMIDLIYKYHVSPTPMDAEAAGDVYMTVFYTGQVGMVYHVYGQEAVWPVEEVMGKPIKAAVLPMQKQRASGDITHQLVVWAKSQNPDAAWEFVKWHATDYETQKGILTEANYGIPALKTTWDEPEVQHREFPPQDIAPFLDPILKDYAYDLEPNAVWAEYWTAASQEFDYAYRGERSVDETLEKTQEAVQKVLDDFYA